LERLLGTEDLAKPSKSMKINGGDDEDRTRDLRRDRPNEAMILPLIRKVS
jgi:hypothetical protein